MQEVSNLVRIQNMLFKKLFKGFWMREQLQRINNRTLTCSNVPMILIQLIIDLNLPSCPICAGVMMLPLPVDNHY